MSDTIEQPSSVTIINMTKVLDLNYNPTTTVGLMVQLPDVLPHLPPRGAPRAPLPAGHYDLVVTRHGDDHRQRAVLTVGKGGAPLWIASDVTMPELVQAILTLAGVVRG